MLRVFRLAMVLVAVCVASASLSAADTNWPTRSVEFVAPANPGGDTDLYLRLFLKHLEKELGQPMIAVNMSGAAGAVGMANVMQAKPDGYRALFFHSGALVNRIMEFIDFSVWEDFQVAAIPIMDKTSCFVISAKNPNFKDLPGMVEYAKANPGKVSFATEMGSYSSLQSIAFEELAGIRFQIVDGGTGSEKIVGLLGNRFDVIYSQYSLVKDYVKNGEFICLGILSDEHLKNAPEVKTFQDYNFDLVFDKFFFAAFPKETPRAIIDKFNAACKKVSESPAFIEDCDKVFVLPNYMTPEQSVEYIKGQDTFFRKYEKQLTEPR